MRAPLSGEWNGEIWTVSTETTLSVLPRCGARGLDWHCTLGPFARESAKWLPLTFLVAVDTPELPTYTRIEVAHHDSMVSCWVIFDHMVLDVTPFLGRHPGGLEILLEHAGMCLPWSSGTLSCVQHSS